MHRSFAPLKMTIQTYLANLRDATLTTHCARSSPFNHRSEKAVAWMHAGDGSQVGSSEKRRNILPAHLARPPQPLQFSLAIGELEFGCAIEHSFYHRFVFLALQRARGINEPPANRKLGKRGLQDGHLPRLKIKQVFGFKPPLDLGVASQSAGAGTRNVGKDTVEGGGERQMTRVRSHYVNVRQANEVLQQARAV